MNQVVKRIFLISMVTMLAGCHSTPTARIPAQEPVGYCMAIRGNGELEPAHWGAMARTVEQLGLPKAMAGGSSGSISMFILEAIASHPLIQNQPIEIQKERASLLLKSLLGAFLEFQKTKTWADIQSLYGVYDKVKTTESLTLAQEFIKKRNYLATQRTLQKAVDLGLLDPKSAGPILVAMAAGDLPRAQFYAQQIAETVKVFGQFNAATDHSLFFRPGIVSFEKAAVGFGKMASFYAAAGSSEKQMQEWQSFFDQCSSGNQNLNWAEINQKTPACSVRFHNLFVAHFAYGKKVPQLEERKVGEVIAAYPTTSVLTGSAVNQFREAKAQYNQKMDPQFGKDFHLQNPDELRFGYWGSTEALERISKSLNPADEKSRRFLALGPAVWKDVLALSPAEPGLSPLKEFKNQNQDYISAGGWSDLQPTLILKAAGCENVVYLTRQGGESFFAQGIAKRLLGMDRDWALLQSSGPGSEKSAQLNSNGDPSDQSSLWSRLYNLANPNSSANHSLMQANAVLCTDWNAYEVTNLNNLIENSYRSSFWINPEQSSSLLSNLNPVLKERRPGCQPL
jgi:hypothetical protein